MPKLHRYSTAETIATDTGRLKQVIYVPHRGTAGFFEAVFETGEQAGAEFTVRSRATIADPVSDALPASLVAAFAALESELLAHAEAEGTLPSGTEEEAPARPAGGEATER